MNGPIFQVASKLNRRMVQADEKLVPPLSPTVHRLLQDRIEAATHCLTASHDPANAGLHARAATFPYLIVSKISIRPPCLNFAVYSSNMLPRRLCRIDGLLITHTSLH